MARPCKTIDSTRIRELAAKGHSIKGIAAMLGVSYDTLHRRYADACETGKELMRTELRAKQVEVAMKGNPVMLIWLGKQELQQSDKQDIDVTRRTILQMVVGIQQNDLNELTNGYFEEPKLIENSAIKASDPRQKDEQ